MSKKVDGFDILDFSSTDSRTNIVHLNVFTATAVNVCWGKTIAHCEKDDN